MNRNVEDPKPGTLTGASASDSASEKNAENSQSQVKPKGFGVAASPFNGIKLELGACVILGMLLWLGADSITADEGTQLLMLLGYSLLCMGWLVLRTRAVLRRYQTGHSV